MATGSRSVEFMLDSLTHSCCPQKRLDYVPGVGIPKNLPFKTSTFAAVTGQGQTGCEAKIKEVYRVSQSRSRVESFRVLTQL